MAELGVVLPKISASPVCVTADTPNVTGRSFTMGGETYELAPRASIKSDPKENPGEHLDSWPSHPLRPAPSTLSMGSPAAQPGHTATTTVVATTAQTKGPSDRMRQSRESVLPKPKFLAHLEGYLEKELRLLGCPSTGPSELRLQAHRETFEYLINEFKTYNPIMSAIQNEYEMYIEYLQEMVSRLKPLETQLVTVREECERKIMGLQEEDKAELKAAKAEIKDLHGVIEHMREKEETLQAQITRLQEELALQFEQYRNEADARKLLISDINDLRARQLEEKATSSTQGDEKEDPVVLKLKLARTREDLKSANKRITTMLADYGDVVPRRDYEGLEGSFQTLEAEHEQLKNDHITLMEEHSTLQSLYRQVCEEKTTLEKEVVIMKRTATPRPDWSRCAEYYTDNGSDGADKWRAVAEDKSSDYLVDVLLAQIAGVDVSEIRKDDNFQAMGVEDTVPAHLRGEGLVQNRHISRKELNQMVNNFWKYRFSHDGPRQMMDDVMLECLLEKNEQDRQLALEDAYNLHDACSRLAHETHVKTFSQILSGKLDEAVYREWIQGQAILTEALRKKAEGKDEVSERDLKVVLQELFPLKDPEALAALMRAAQDAGPTAGGNVIKLTAILTPDDSGCPSDFVTCLLKQSIASSREFAQQVSKLLEGRGEVTLDETRSAILAVDPAISPREVARVLTVVFGVDPDQVAEASASTVPHSDVVMRLSQSGLQHLRQ